MIRYSFPPNVAARKCKGVIEVVDVDDDAIVETSLLVATPFEARALGEEIFAATQGADFLNLVHANGTLETFDGATWKESRLI